MLTMRDANSGSSSVSSGRTLPAFLVGLNALPGGGREGHQPLFVALAENVDPFLVYIDVAGPQTAQLAGPNAGIDQDRNNGQVAHGQTGIHQLGHLFVTQAGLALFPHARRIDGQDSVLGDPASPVSQVIRRP